MAVCTTALGVVACGSGAPMPAAAPDSGWSNPTSDSGVPASGQDAQAGGRDDASGDHGFVDAASDVGGDAGLRTADAEAGLDAFATAHDGSATGNDAGAAANSGIRWIGRVDATNPRAVKFAWSGTGLVATVTGAKISVQLQTEGATSAFFQPVIDGTPLPRFQVTSGAAQTVVLGNALSTGDHTVELYREDEGMYGDSVFSGFVDGMVKGAPPASGRLIEIIGDSISAGYGNLGTEVHPPYTSQCTFSLDTQSAYRAYGWAIARSLNAEASIIARSGWGMYRDLGGSTTGVLSSIYEDTLGTQTALKWNFKRQADVVIIDLGTNDSAKGDPGQPYEDAYVAFLHTVRGHYPNAWIFLTVGPMTSDPLLTQMRTHISNVVSRVADSKIAAVDMPAQNGAMTGCDFHPNVAEDVVMAGVLTPVIKQQLAW